MRALLVLAHGVPVLGVPKHALHLQAVGAWEYSSMLGGSTLCCAWQQASWVQRACRLHAAEEPANLQTRRPSTHPRMPH